MASQMNDMQQRVMNLPNNMGTMDRIIRSAIGGALLTCGMMSRKPTGLMNMLSRLVGGACVVYGITGWDPLLSAFKVTTKEGDSDNVMNRIRQTTQQRSQSQSTTTGNYAQTIR